MPSLLSIAASSLAFSQLASAHGYVAGIKVNQGPLIAGANPNWYDKPSGTAPVSPGWQSLNQDRGYVNPTLYKTSDIACHKSAKAGQTYISANPDDVLTLYWDTWPSTHRGPIINYLAQCSGECTSETASRLSFTKITQDALLVPGTSAKPGTWITDTLIAQDFTIDFKIPSGLAPGNYVLRHEIIALHDRVSNGTQNYPQCLNLKVGGSGSKALPVGIPATEFYNYNDPGILFNLYASATSYPYPGPAVWSG